MSRSRSRCLGIFINQHNWIFGGLADSRQSANEPRFRFYQQCQFPEPFLVAGPKLSWRHSASRAFSRYMACVQGRTAPPTSRALLTAKWFIWTMMKEEEGEGGWGRGWWWWWWMIDDGLSMILHDWRCMVHDIAWWMVWWGDGRRDGWLAGWWNSQKDFWVQVKPACDILWPWKLWKYSWWPLFYRRLAALKSSKKVQNKFASSSSKTKNKGMPSWKDRSLTSAFCFSSTATAALCQTPYSRGEVVVECSSRHFLASTIALKRLLKQQRRNLPKSAATKSANINKDTKNKTR